MRRWVFRKHHDVAVALMTGVIAGSLMIIWPWKNSIYLLDDAGNPVMRHGEKVIQGYEWFLPPVDMTTLVAILLIGAGILGVCIIEKMGGEK